MAIVSIKVDGSEVPFTYEFATGRWTAPADLEEGIFPLSAEIDGRRYEFYSDGTFNEVER